MSAKLGLRYVAVVMFAIGALQTFRAQMPNPYGLSITVDDARKAAAPALAEAAKNNWKVAVAIVDPAGTLVYYEKMDNTQLGSANVAIDKARSAARFSVRPRRFKMHWPPAATAFAFWGLRAQCQWMAAFHW